MPRIEETFQRLRVRGEKAFIPYLTAGDPDLRWTGRFIKALAGGGADLIEIGVPFSDPIADGPTIQKASQRALRSGATLGKVIRLVGEIRAEVSTPLVLMGYYNPIFKMGVEVFARESSRSGVDGLIVPDLPPEEAAPLISACREWGIDTIFLVAPTTPLERLQQVAEVARGFLYYVSLTGVTGAREQLAAGIREAVAGIRTQTSLPIAVGFGISTPDQARLVSQWADGVVVGSTLVDLIDKTNDKEELEVSLSSFALSFKQALQDPPSPL